MNVSAKIDKINYQVTINSEGHSIIADEPLSNNGGDTGMAPEQLLLSSLGACIAITLRMYSLRKEWNVGNISVNLSLETGNGLTTISKEINYSENITAEQKDRLNQISKNCPISKILLGEIKINTI